MICSTLLQIDAEVRDRILCMTEDYANILPQPEFRESYELLLVREEPVISSQELRKSGTGKGSWGESS